MNMALDNQHGELEETLERLVRLATLEGDPKIDIMVLAFKDLKPVLETRIRDAHESIARLMTAKAKTRLHKRLEEIQRALNLNKKRLQDAEDTYAMYHEVMSVATSLSTSEAKQDLLIRAGQAVVETHKKHLHNCLLGKGLSE
jgi:hypothetical protein